MFTPDKTIGYLSLILIFPPILYFSTKFKGTAFVLYLIITFSFIIGSLEIVLGIDPILSRQMIEVLIITMLIIILLKQKNLKLKYLEYVLLFLALCFFSFVINEVTWIQLLLFLRKYLLIVIIFWLVDKLEFDSITIKNLIKYCLVLFICQIFINIARFPITSITEEYIGSIAVRGGSITTIISLLGITFAFSFFLYNKKIRYIFLVIGFIVFGLIGGKRAIVFLIPIILLVEYIFYLKKTNRISIIIGKAPVVIMLALVTIYAGVRLLPSLNTDNVIGGRFDLNFVSSWFYQYNYTQKEIGYGKYYGRGEAVVAVYNLLNQKYAFINILMGLGPGDIIMSGYVQSPSSLVTRSEDITAFKYDIGYGARTGLLFTGLQIGLLGVISFLLIIMKIYLPYFKMYFGSSFQKRSIAALNLGVIISFIVFLIDYIFYSRAFFESIPILFTLFILQKHIYKVSASSDRLV